MRARWVAAAFAGAGAAALSIAACVYDIPPLANVDAGHDGGDATDDTDAAMFDESVVTLATGQANAFEIAVDSTNVYWTTTQADGSVMKCAISGCDDAPTAIATNQEFPWGIALDDAGGIYWTNGGASDAATGAVMRCDIAACAGGPTVVASSQAHPGGIALDSTRVYWANSGLDGGGSIESCPLVGCDADGGVAFASSVDEGFGYVALDSTYVYWSGLGDVYACGKGGCDAATTLGSGEHDVDSLVAAGGGAYWTVWKISPTTDNRTALLSCPAAGCASPNVIAAQPGGDELWGLALDSTNAYWSDIATQSIMTCAVAACTPTVVTKHFGYYLAVDSTSVYWTNYADGAIMRTPK